MRFATIGIFCFVFTFLGNAQMQNIVPVGDTLKVVTIVDQRLAHLDQDLIQSLDSMDRAMHMSADLGELLQHASGFNLKVYGPGGISSISMRGGQASQTAVLWNGINLQDPLNGGVNFSLIPSFFVDNVAIHAGGYSALFGSGAVSGSVHTSSNLIFGDGLNVSLQQEFASFGNKQTGLDIRYSGKRFLNTTKFLYREAQNDFPYVNDQEFGNPIQNQSNAAMKEIGIMQENAFFLGKKSKLSSHIWFMQNHHEVPSNMTVKNADQSQEDFSLKTLLAWKYVSKKWNINVRSAHFHTQLKYISPSISLIAEHASYVNKNEIDFQRSWNKKLSINGGLSQQFVKGNSEQLQGASPQLNSLAASFTTQYYIKDIVRFDLNLRQESRDQVFKSPSVSFSVISDAWHGFKFWTRFSRNYRMPTFNDLYWEDAYSKGNADLQDEYSYSEDVNLLWSKKMRKHTLEIQATAFNQNIHNMIQWLPDEGLWTPVNHQKVRSNGIEGRLNYSFSYKKIILYSKSNYQYTRSTLLKNSTSTTTNIGNQLIYTPYHQGSTTLSIQWRKLYFSYNQNYIGKRFTDMENKKRNTLAAAWPIHMQLGTRIKLKKHTLQLAFKANNISDQAYQLVKYYPMPGIHYGLEVKYNFKQKN